MYKKDCNKFLEKGPDSSVRSARHFTANNVRLILNFISFFLNKELRRLFEKT